MISGRGSSPESCKVRLPSTASAAGSPKACRARGHEEHERMCICLERLFHGAGEQPAFRAKRTSHSTRAFAGILRAGHPAPSGARSGPPRRCRRPYASSAGKSAPLRPHPGERRERGRGPSSARTSGPAKSARCWEQRLKPLEAQDRWKQSLKLLEAQDCWNREVAAHDNDGRLTL